MGFFEFWLFSLIRAIFILIPLIDAKQYLCHWENKFLCGLFANIGKNATVYIEDMSVYKV